MSTHAATNERDFLLHVEEAGAGDRTIVLLPGLLGSTSYWKAAKFGSLEAENRLIYVDPLGFGRSPRPRVDYTLDDHLDALRRTLVSRGATKHVVIVGHSFGTILAAYYADRYPDDVEALVLFGAPVYENAVEARARVGEMSGLAGLLVNSRLLARIVCALHNATIPLTRRLAPHMRRDLPPEVARDATLHNWPSLDGSVRYVILNQPISSALRASRARLIIVYGSRDDVSDSARVRALVAATGATFVETDDVHASYWKGAAGILTQTLAKGVTRGGDEP